MSNESQLDLFHVKQAYMQAGGPIDNEALYERVAALAHIAPSEMDAKQEIGKSGAPRSKVKRKIRWFQQTLKALNLISRVDRGVWDLSDETKSGLHTAKENVRLLAYSTTLGMAIWGNSKSVFSSLGEPIHLCVTSPPYPLRVARGYGNVDESAWVDFITESLEGIVRNLAVGGSIVLNISNDIFETKRPSRSLYVERMVIALHDRLGLSLMDRWPWVNLSKMPGPTHWACVNRVQLCSGWEPVFWFTNDPLKVRSDNRRVLERHTDKQEKLFDAGGESRVTNYGDGAYKLRAGSFAQRTAGKIPKNVIMRGHSCADTQRLRKIAGALGLPPHPAMYPTALPEFAIKLLTQEGDLVVDPFAGSNKTGLAAQRNNRRWVGCDLVLEYMRTQAEMFCEFPGFWMNPALGDVA